MDCSFEDLGRLLLCQYTWACWNFSVSILSTSVIRPLFLGTIALGTKAGSTLKTVFKVLRFSGKEMDYQLDVSRFSLGKIWLCLGNPTIKFCNSSYFLYHCLKFDGCWWEKWLDDILFSLCATFCCSLDYESLDDTICFRWFGISLWFTFWGLKINSFQKLIYISNIYFWYW